MSHSNRLLKIAAIAASAIMVPLGLIHAQSSATVLKAADAQPLIPASVFYRGQTATTQLRNSGGVKFDDGYYVLAVLVDTGGYSTQVASKYQAYFITEIPIMIAGQNLPAGAYGVGFIANDKFVVTDLGGHDVFSVDSATDEGLKRPVPLQVMTDPNGGFRLYAGRRFVRFSR
jgi:hypothetical protein